MVRCLECDRESANIKDCPANYLHRQQRGTYWGVCGESEDAFYVFIRWPFRMKLIRRFLRATFGALNAPPCRYVNSRFAIDKR
jgi:hypothetical protein